MSATDLSPLVPPWRELEPVGEMSEDQILDRLEQEVSAAREWSPKGAEFLILAVGNWVMLIDHSDEAVNRLNGLLGQFGFTESRRFG